MNTINPGYRITSDQLDVVAFIPVPVVKYDVIKLFFLLNDCYKEPTRILMMRHDSEAF